MTLKNLTLFSFGLLLFTSACKQSVDVKDDYTGPSVTNPNTQEVSITTPSNKTHYSNATDLLVQGVCRDSARVFLRGDSRQEVKCEGQTFSFSINKETDDFYNFTISQQIGSYTSPGKSLTWVKKSSVSLPAVTQPNVDPFTSASSTLTVQGGCEEGAQLVLEGDVTAETRCQNSAFTLTANKFMDGNYNVIVKQTDRAGNEASISFTWQKVGLSVTPNDPQVVVTETEVFTVNGGNPPYTTTFVENNSGASFNATSLEYVAGEVAGVIDRIEIVDRDGFSEVVDISVIPDVPDHLEFPANSGNNQNQTINQDFENPIVSKVVDRFGNAVSNFKVVFKNITGDLFFKDSPIQTSDAEGLVRMNLKQGRLASRSHVAVSSLDTPLPDVNAEGKKSLRYQTVSSNTNTGNIGLNFNVGNGAEDITIRDFNEDGQEDVAVLNKNDRNISVFSGTDTGILKRETTVINLCNSPSSLLAEDFNNDMHLDFILTCASGESFYFIEGNGNATFNTPVALATDANENLIIDVASGDINGDGVLDLAMLSAGANVVAVRTGNNDGTFNTPQIYNTGGSPSRVLISDVDGVNGSDVLVLNSADENFYVYFNDGSGSLIEPDTNTTYFTSVAPAGFQLIDVNADTHKDIVVTSNVENKVSVMLNSGSGEFTPPNDTSVGNSPTALHAFDYNNDNSIDLFVVNTTDNTVSVLDGNGTGVFTLSNTITTMTTPMSLSSSDFNGDGLEDLAVVANGVSKLQLIMNSGEGLFNLVTPTSADIVSLLSGDFDNDGIIDQAAVSANQNSVQIYKGDGLGNYEPTTSITIGVVTPSTALTDDFNSDGLLDIVVTNSGNNTLAVYTNEDNGNFSTPTILPTGIQPSGLASGDFNSDGFLDIVVTNGGSNSFSTFLGDGSGDFGSRVDTNTGSQPTGVQAADFNNDNILDVALVTESDTTDNLAVFSGNGDGSFQSPNTYNAETGPSQLVVRHLNSDAHLDVAVLNKLSSTLSVFFGEPGGSLQSATSYLAGTAPESMMSADINGDSFQDLLITNGLNQKLNVLYGGLSGNYSITEEIDTGINASEINLNDLNSDGALDISIIDGTNNRIKVFLGH